MLKIFNLIGVGEHAGSGVPEIYEVWEKEGLDKPIVEEQFGATVPDRTKLILPLASPSLGTNLGTNLGTSIGANDGAEIKLLDFCKEPRSKKEIQEYLGIQSERYVRQEIIATLIKSGKLARTNPETTTSPKQKYYSTNLIKNEEDIGNDKSTQKSIKLDKYN